MNDNLLKKMAATCAGIVLSLTATQIKPVQAASVFWDLNFFNDSGEQIGNGEFSYDPEKTAIVTFNTFTPTTGTGTTTISVTGIVDSFSVNVAGLEWGTKDFRNRTFWWVPNNSESTKGQSVRVRSVIPVSIVNSWQLIENDVTVGPFGPYTRFSMSGGSTEFLGEGTWEQTEVVARTDSSGNFMGYNFLETKGVWTGVQRNAKSIPEASSVFALLGLGATAFSRKLRVKF
ncbi:hypothetical protein [Brasilonema sp. UFV-L1]|uniref:hypothetical protein n=1 Tax=Brasilonema sp. UFV-L1 TaxID=2234130 RepID=UPI00145C9782|nr:hypothetical protein [Brasilonema sp. UFV-L1]NMG07639.1 hypothetical protein [Brasilonema sp. UFV-L1]